ncbi:MAG: hypothetical protein ACFB2W_02965 [Leptolyngbyaceae cyanobacterium]
MRTLWLTCDFSDCLSGSADGITPQLFLTLMAHPAVNQIKRFTQSNTLTDDEIAQWEPGIFTMQVYRSNVLEVLTNVASTIAESLASQGDKSPGTMTIYTQLGARHYPTVTRLSPHDIGLATQAIKTMVSQYESGALPSQADG